MGRSMLRPIENIERGLLQYIQKTGEVYLAPDALQTPTSRTAVAPVRPWLPYGRGSRKAAACCGPQRMFERGLLQYIKKTGEVYLAPDALLTPTSRKAVAPVRPRHAAAHRGCLSGVYCNKPRPNPIFPAPMHPDYFVYDHARRCMVKASGWPSWLVCARHQHRWFGHR